MDYPEPHPFRWTREDYSRLCEAEWFAERRVQLIGGELVEYDPESGTHCAARSLTDDALRLAFGKGFWVRPKGPLDVSRNSVPQPDLAVVPRTPRDYSTRDTPNTALLAVEVSEATLEFDRNIKASLYAAAGIADYWIVNLVQRQLEVSRDPVADPVQPFGFRYGSRTVLDPGDSVSPLAAPRARIAVADLLP
jgi:Uma2 family endonuclease